MSDCVADALRALGIRRFALAIHDLSLPSAPDEDAGRGAPASDESGRFLAFVRRLGFDAIQLGPQGETPASPYDSTWFSRNTASLAWQPLARGDHGTCLLDERALAALAGARPTGATTRVDHRAVYELEQRALDLAWSAFQAEPRDLAPRLAAFEQRHAGWLEPYSRDLAPGARARWRFGQHLAHEQHAFFRARARSLGLALLADLQIGPSERDRCGWPDAFLSGWRLGAPPSRTNPDGQPWGHSLLDPSGCRRGGDERALAIFRLRIAKLFAEYDGVRIDHPHGLVDPWVYRAGDPDPLHAVQRGARLFGTPASPEHPELARLAIARPDDLNPDPRTRPWADDWVVRLAPEQVDRYAMLLDEFVALARARGRGSEDIACEVLSTLPYPLARAIGRHGLGRLRVTQKADPADPRDVYRSENAAPEDWIMIGTHDTKPIWRLVHEWQRDGSAAARAQRVAERLAGSDRERTSLASAMARDAQLLALGHLSELFASPARHVMIFFTDLFGLADVYNEPGTVSDANWTLRLPPTWRRDYAERRAAGRAFDLPRALALALRARGLVARHADLIAALDAESLAGPRASCSA